MIFGDKSIPSEQQQTIWNEDNTKLDMVSPLKANSNKKRLNMKTVVTLLYDVDELLCGKSQNLSD